jgi:exodeoxyribonuclease VII large subunit
MQTGQQSFTRDIYTITRLNREVRAVLEGSFPTLWVQGEISNLAKPASGHLYFSLKDKHSQVRCAMFKNRNQVLNFSPENGMEIIAQASISLYEGRGEFQLIVNQLEPAGIGALQLAFEQLKERLQLEGLFAEQHKNPVPLFPRRIGVITSPSGAAIRDILHVLQRRYPFADVIIYPVPVQGQDSGIRIAEMIATAGIRNECEVIILARGGGSIEDLWSFNDEKVARAIYQSAIPVVTGIGHEIDFTIADFVADKRAPTPSAAAELVSPDQYKLIELIDNRQRQLFGSIRRRLLRYRELLDRHEKRLPHPARQLQNLGQLLDEAGLRMIRTINTFIKEKYSTIFRLRAELNQFNPAQRLSLHRQKCQHLDKQLRSLASLKLTASRNQLETLAHALHTVSPLATLDRGYAIVTSLDDGRILRNIAELETGKQIKTRIANGIFHSTVTGILNNDE